MSSSTLVAPTQRRARRWISAWLPVIFGVAVIACESTAYFGADHTTGPLRDIWEWIFGRFSDDSWEFTHHLIRKTGHFVGYGTLGLLWLRAWSLTRKNPTGPHSAFLQNALLALLGTALVASCDEFHQTFLPNRTGSPWDVLLDCCGAMVLISARYILLRLSAPGRRARAA